MNLRYVRHATEKTDGECQRARYYSSECCPNVYYYTFMNPYVAHEEMVFEISCVRHHFPADGLRRHTKEEWESLKMAYKILVE